MKKRSIWMSIVLAVVMVFTLGFATACDNRPLIAIVAKGESHAFWQSVKKGAVAAGDELGYKISFRGPATESASDLPIQKEMVTSALASDPKGMVLATIGTGFVDLLTQAKDKGIPVVQFDSGVWKDDTDALDAAKKNPIVSSVATSNYKAAEMAAEDFFANIKTDIAAATAEAPYIIGVIQHDETQTGIDRAGGFVDKITALIAADSTTAGKAKIEKEVKPGDKDNNYVAALQALFEKKVNAIFMSNEGVVKQVYDQIETSTGQYDKIKFYGFDAGTKQIEWMKKTTGPKLIGAVAQDSYAIGYNAVVQCVNAIKGEKVEETVAIGGSVWNADNVDEKIAAGIVYTG